MVMLVTLVAALSASICVVMQDADRGGCELPGGLLVGVTLVKPYALGNKNRSRRAPGWRDLV